MAKKKTSMTDKELEETINLAYSEVLDEIEDLMPKKKKKSKNLESKKKSAETTKKNKQKEEVEESINNDEETKSESNNDNKDNKFKRVITWMKKYRVINILNYLLTLILLIVTIKLDMIPTKLLVIGFSLKLLFDSLGLVLNLFNKKWCTIIGYTLTIIMIIVNIVGIYYISVTDSFFGKNFGKTKVTYTIKYNVVATKASNSTIDTMDGKKLGYYKDSPSIDEALKKLDKKTENVSYEDVVEMFKVLDKDINYILIDNSLYDLLFETDKTFNKEDYAIIYSFEIEVEEDTKDLTGVIEPSIPDIIDEDENIIVNPNNINIYIGGTDFTGAFYDLNMIVTINPDAKKILLTSIPRDYHITVAGRGRQDNLNYIGALGINTTMASLQNLLNIKIDYYVKVNTNSLVGIVDTLGGLTYCSDQDYWTTHDVILDTYADTGRNKLHVTRGCRRYNGIQTLTIARERQAFTGGDRQRQKNCQTILINIFKEMTKPGNIANYNNVLNSLSHLYTTSIPRSVISDLAKDTINNGTNWQIETQSLNGLDGNGYVHLGAVKDYVMTPITDSVKQGSRKIRGF